MSETGFEDEEQMARAGGKVLMHRILAHHADFSIRWDEYLRSEGGESIGPYIDISEYAHFIDDELFVAHHAEKVRDALLFLDAVFLDSDEPTRNLIAIGFIEDLQNCTSTRADGHSKVKEVLPPTLLRVWNSVAAMWAGKSNLMEMIRAEAQYTGPERTWAQILELE